MTTPERAVELAVMAEQEANDIGTGYGKPGYDLLVEVAAILRHYAEIMQAEPVEIEDYLSSYEWRAEDNGVFELTNRDRELLQDFVNGLPLYTAPPAQAVSVPSGWVALADACDHPKLESIDILMGDGSILCNLLPQSDGDLWWDGAGAGEKFIDPTFADITHWRYSAPEQPK